MHERQASAELTVIDQLSRRARLFFDAIVDRERVGAVNLAAIEVGQRIKRQVTGHCCTVRCPRRSTWSPGPKTSC